MVSFELLPACVLRSCKDTKMSISIPSVCSLLIAMVCLVTAPVDRVLGQIDRELEFRIETKMFTEDGKEPAFTNKTIFSQGLIFDFPMAAGNKAPEEVLVYDSNLKVISLLDLKRQMQVRLLDVQLKKMTDSVRQQMATDDRARAMVEQTFEEKLDADKGSLELIGSQNMTYRLYGTTPKSPKLLSAYFEFLDVFTQVQITDPKKLPPFARLRLNESIRRVGWVPDRVEVSVGKSDFFPSSFKARTEHKIFMDVTDRDRSEITLAKKNWAALPEVSLAKYRGFKEKSSFFERVAEGAKQGPSKAPTN